MDRFEQHYNNGQWVDSIGGTPHQVDETPMAQPVVM